jgi:hypothetical protein
VRPSALTVHRLIMTRLYDEKKPLEPAYSSESSSTARNKDAKKTVEDLEVKRLLHAPPG